MTAINLDNTSVSQARDGWPASVTVPEHGDRMQLSLMTPGTAAGSTALCGPRSVQTAPALCTGAHLWGTIGLT